MHALCNTQPRLREGDFAEVEWRFLARATPLTNLLLCAIMKFLTFLVNNLCGNLDATCSGRRGKRRFLYALQALAGAFFLPLSKKILNYSWFHIFFTAPRCEIGELDTRLRSSQLCKILVSKETVVLRRWEIETEIDFIKRVDKGRITTVQIFHGGYSTFINSFDKIDSSQLLVFTHVINSHVFQRKQKEAFA